MRARVEGKDKVGYVVAPHSRGREWEEVAEGRLYPPPRDPRLIAPSPRPTSCQGAALCGKAGCVGDFRER